jgi:hypothetical protein
MGSSTNAQTVVVDANNLVGVTKLSTKFVEGALTGTTPNATISGVAITSALNAGWFSINPNQQPTSGTYDVTMKIQASTNLSPTVGNYVIIKRNNATSPWATAGNYNVATTAGGIVTIKNSNLTSFSDFAIGRAASDIGLSSNDFTKNSVSLYPNPTSNSLSLSFDNYLENGNLKIISTLGQTVLEKQNLSGSNFNFDVSTFANGIYVVQIGDGNRVNTIKFVKQ